MPRRFRKDFFGEDGEDSGSEKVEWDGVVGGENDIDRRPSVRPRDMKLS